MDAEGAEEDGESDLDCDANGGGVFQLVDAGGGGVAGEFLFLFKSVR